MEPLHKTVARKPWQVAQVGRLEEERTKALEERTQWFEKEEEEKKKKKEGWEHHQGWWSQHGNWHSWAGGRQWGWRWDTGAASSEPTASAAASSGSQDNWWTEAKELTPDGVAEDLRTYRSTIMSPASFQPQRHVTMVLGRPVVVLLGQRFKIIVHHV